MAGRSKEVTDEIRRRINILDVVSVHVTLKRSGRRYTGLCPFHSEKTPSFTVNPELGFFYCFGCHAGGDVFDFVMRTGGVPFPDALAELAGRAGITLERTAEEEQQGGERERLLRTVAEAAAYYRAQLAAEAGAPARRYLAERGVDAAAAEAFRLGYAPAGWDGLLRALRARGFDGAALEQAGLAIARAGGDGHYDALRQRLIFPIHDLQGRPVAFGGRALDDATPKYLNTRETALFAKGRTLYALDTARAAIRESGEAVVVEGYMDALACHQFGVTNAVASLGTALTPDQVLLLKRFAGRAVLVYDADASGMDAAERGLGVFEQAELPVRVAVLPGGADPDEFMREKGVEAFRALLDGAQSVFDYRFAMASARHDGRTVEGKVGIVDEMSQLIIIAPNPVRQSEYVRLLAERLGVREDAIRGQFRRLAKDRDDTRRPAGTPRRAPESDGRVGAEALLLHLLVADASVRAGVRDLLDADAFREPVHHLLAQALLDPEAQGIEPGRLRERLQDDRAISLLSRFLIEEPPVRGDARRVAEGCLRTMRLVEVGERIDRLTAAHAEAVRGRDDHRRDELAAELLEARKEKERIRELKVSV
ncbi:MAG TPA: DNA primase [bacterium]|nr:DNA primase [bacterium]